MSRRQHMLAALLVAALLLAAPVSAHAGETVVIQDTDLSEYPQVTMSVSLPGDMLGGDDPVFSVSENGMPIENVTAAKEGAEANPIDVMLVIDTSGSMTGEPLERAKEAAEEFLATLDSRSRVALVTFGSSPRIISGFTSNRADLTARVRGLEAGGETALYDAIVVAAELGRTTAQNLAGIVVLSDGGDTMSRANLDATVKSVKAGGAPVFSVALPSYEADPAALKTVSAQSGGRLVALGSLSGLPELYRGIAEEIQGRYLVKYAGLQPNTKDLEIRVVATLDDRQATALAVLPNPVYAESVPIDETARALVPESDVGALALAAGFVWAALALFVVGIALFVIKPRTTLEQLRFYEQLRATGEYQTAEDADPGSLKQRMMGAVGYVAGKRGLTDVVRQALSRAGLPLRPVEYMTIHMALVAGVGGAVALLTRNNAAAVMIVLVTTIAPLLFISFRATQRTAAFEDQLPGVLNLISGSLRAGWGMLQSIDVVVRETLPPTSEEFKRVQTEARLGLPVEAALQNMAERVGSDDFSWAVAAIAIQREVGGNLAEVLDIVADTLRERSALKRQVKALTAEGRLSAGILIGMPFFIIAFLLVLNPSYITLLFTTTTGMAMTSIGAALLCIGAVWLFRVTQVEV